MNRTFPGLLATVVALLSPAQGQNLVADYKAPSVVPVTAAGFAATGRQVQFTLGCALPAGAVLTVVNNRALDLIQGQFDNLVQGQRVELAYDGVIYPFVADYYGGTGNDLVLQPANLVLLKWGGTVGAPPVYLTGGAVAGKTVVEASGGLLLCADGTLAAVGNNTYGQLGNGTNLGSSQPVLVNRAGVLAGKTVIAVAAGSMFSVALCADGTVASWGSNFYSELGNGITGNSNVPVAVDRSGALAGKTVVAISAGDYHTLALCSDGSVVAWGRGTNGQLGNGAILNSRVPVAVSTAGVLAGKRVIGVSAGEIHSLVLREDGVAVGWGENGYRQLGNGVDSSTAASYSPVLVDRSGVLASRTVVELVAGRSFGVARCSDGSVVTWGGNGYGQLGCNSTASWSAWPVLVDHSGALAGRVVVSIAAGARHALAVCADGGTVAWGDNYFGQLGVNSISLSRVPVAVTLGTVGADQRFVRTVAVCSGWSSDGFIGSPPPPQATTTAATRVAATSAVLNGQVAASGATATITFEYGPTPAYGSVLAASPATVSGSAAVPVAAFPSGLTPGTTYHFRVVATGSGGTVAGQNFTFTTGHPPTFAGYALTTRFETPVAVALAKLLAKAADPDGDPVTIMANPTTANGGSVLQVADRVIYTPLAGFSGTDTIILMVASPTEAIGGTVTVAVEPPAGTPRPVTNPPQISVLADGRLALVFHGIPGRTYRIERSADLTTWQGVADVAANANGVVGFTDPVPLQPNGYYRLALP